MTGHPATGPRTSGAADFAVGTVIGLALVPLSLAVGLVTGGGGIAGWVTFAVLTAGALTRQPVRPARAGGVLTGLLVAAGTGFAWVVWALSNSTWG